MSIFATNRVYWEEDETRSRLVRDVCRVCQSFMVREYGLRITVNNAGIVSPSGLAHAQHDFDEGHTACGKDATGGDWWWRS